jgi:hypothetical protein
MAAFIAIGVFTAFGAGGALSFAAVSVPLEVIFVGMGE